MASSEVSLDVTSLGFDAEARLDEGIALLVGLEHERARLAEGRLEPAGSVPLTALSAIVNAVVEFVTARCGDARVLPSRVLSQLAEEQPYTQLLGEENERITVSTATAILDGWTSDDADRRRLGQDLCRALIIVLEVYGAAVATLFRSPHDRDEWQATFEMFVADLRTAVQQIAV